MKCVVSLKIPNFDIIGDVEKDKMYHEHVVIRNPCILQWLSEHIKIVPFKPCKENEFEVNAENIAMIYEAIDKIGTEHNKVVKEHKENGCTLLTKQELDDYKAEEQRKLIEKTKKQRQLKNK